MTGIGNSIYLICQNGAEAALKREVARAHPELKFAFSRPGFVTFKSERSLPPEFAPDLVLARAFGLSLGKTREAPTSATFVDALRSELARLATVPEIADEAIAGHRLHLHVWERDFFEPDAPTPAGFDPFRAPREIEERLRVAIPFASGAPKNDDLVLDVIRVEESEIWFGIHRHTPLHPSFAGGRFAGSLPEAAPSRAYLKLEEAIALYQIPMRAGEIAVEIGSAPGGASYSLVERGLQVLGIDPGAMDPTFVERAGSRFEHLRKSVVAVERDELPERFEWLLLDMNVAPETAFLTLDEWLPALIGEKEGTLKGVVLTIKLNDWRLADEIPMYLERLRAAGLTRLRARQLSSNKREFCVYGVTRAALKLAPFRVHKAQPGT